MNNSTDKGDFREDLTNSIIEALENGTAPWQKPWDGSNNFRRPVNAISKRQYNGINALNLALKASVRSFEDPRWCTYKQAQEQGWQVRKGEKGTPVEFWMFSKNVPVTNEKGKPVIEDDGKPIKREQPLEKPFVQYFYVFNAQQMEGVPNFSPRPQHDWNPSEKAEHILTLSGANIKHDEADRAYYSSIKDEIHLPDKNRFASEEQYYATALHELGHWTGHSSRLNRQMGNTFGSQEYAKEELRAEIASLFIASETGVPHHIEQHAAYVKSWIEVLKNDKNEIFRAARDADKITEYVLGIEKEKDLGKQQSQHQPQVSLADAITQARSAYGDNCAFVHENWQNDAKIKVHSADHMLRIASSSQELKNKSALPPSHLVDTKRGVIINTLRDAAEYRIVTPQTTNNPITNQAEAKLHAAINDHFNKSKTSPAKPEPELPSATALGGFL